VIQEFVNKFMESKSLLAAEFSANPPTEYKDVVRAVTKVLSDVDYGLDPERIHEIDDGDYQGVLVYVIGEPGYCPSNYWYVRIDYGSCAACDTLLAAEGVDDYMTLALHVVQGLKSMRDGIV